jgi:hypothetical protein
MRAKAIIASLIVWAAHSTYAFAVEPLAIDPDVTQFRFTSEAHGAHRFCNLIVSAVKLPGLRAGSGNLNRAISGVSA